MNAYTHMNEDPIMRMIGEIVICAKTNGKTFSGRLVAVKSEELWFETRDGKWMMDRRQSIATICPYKPRSTEEIGNVQTT